MRKKLFIAAMAGFMTMALAMPVFAGEWKQSEAGWWYENDDGSYPNGGWTWLDGKCYYFTPEGYCLIDTQTPDGYMVDGSGAWIVDGVVQTQGAEQNTQTQTAAVTVLMDNMTFTLPEGFEQDTTQQDGVFLLNESQQVAIAFVAEKIPEIEQYQQYMTDSLIQILLDAAIKENMGTPTGKDSRQFGSGLWYRYDYADASYLGIPGSINAYVRINGTNFQMIVFAGDISGMDTDAVMNNNLK